METYWAYIIAGVFLFFVIMLVTRDILTWYWKISAILEQQKETNETIKVLSDVVIKHLAREEMRREQQKEENKDSD